MPVEFLSKARSEGYGRFVGEPTPEQLARYFHFDDYDLNRILRRRGDHNRLGFALQLGTVRFLGTFLPNPIDVPPGVISYVSSQLNITQAACLPRYIERKQTHHAHRTEIQETYQYWEFNELPWGFRLSRWLYTRTWLSNERPSHLFELATEWLILQKVLLPGISTLTRLIAQIRERAARRAWHRLASLPSIEQRRQLDALLMVPEGKRRSRFDQLRQGPRHVSSPSMIMALERYEELQELGIRELDFSQIPPVWLQSLTRYATTGWAPTIARMPEDRRIATLVAFAYTYTATTLDDALDVFDLLITDIAASAKTLGLKKRIRSLHDLDTAALALADVCSVLLDEVYPDDEVRKAIFSKIPVEQITQAITTTHELVRPPEEDYQEEMLTRYQTVRRFLPRVLDTISFKAAPAGNQVLIAVDYLQSLQDSSQPQLNDAPLDVVNTGWKRLVVDQAGNISQPAYTLCVMERLQDRLRRRDIYVEDGERWSDPRAKLLQGTEWEAKRTHVCHILGHSTSPDDIVARLGTELDTTYRRVSARFADNDAVRVEYKDGKATLTITNLDKLEDPVSLIDLRKQTAALLPQIDLAELLLEIQAKTGFADEFTHVSEAESRADDLSTSICAVLLSESCNIGLRAVEHRDHPALTRGRLNWVQQNYIRAETLTRANARLVDYQATLPLAQQWGGGDVASADGLRFVTPVRTLNAGPNRKYFGSDRGLTYYNFTSNQFTGLHGIAVPGTLRDSIFILEGLLEQQTSLNPTEIMTDTAGASDMVFGLFWLLGYQFSPRLADAGEASFWRLDMQADYAELNDIARHRARTDRIQQHWDDMLRVAGSLKLGTVHASELV